MQNSNRDWYSQSRVLSLLWPCGGVGSLLCVSTVTGLKVNVSERMCAAIV